MRAWINNKMVECQLKSNQLFQRLIREEDGDQTLVTVIVLIVIVIAVAAIFQGRLTEAIGRVFDNLMDFIG